MNVTKKAITERLKLIDVVIELLDARLPGSSSNPMLGSLTAGKHKLKVLNKQDVADPIRTQLWLDYFNLQPHTQAIALDAGETQLAQSVVKRCKELVPHRNSMEKPLRLLICGVPNVGKSTLLNTLIGKRAAKTGDEAGITRTEQRINLANNVFLYDTPGMLWPKILVEKAGYHLAASGAVGKNAYDEEDVALELLHTLKSAYADQLAERYQLPNPAAIPAMHDDTLLSHIGQYRGALRTGGKIDLTKAAEILIRDFRSGMLGGMTLETPQDFSAWEAASQATEQKRELERLLKKKTQKKPQKKT